MKNLELTELVLREEQESNLYFDTIEEYDKFVEYQEDGLKNVNFIKALVKGL